MKKLLLILLFSIIAMSAAFADTIYHTYLQNSLYYNGQPINNRIYGVYSKCDPISISYRYEKYYMIKDDGGPYNRKSLLGCDDWSRSTLFDPLINLNSDNIWERLTPDEIRKANVRFVRVKTNGKLDIANKEHDFDLDKVMYIDLYKFRIQTNSIANGEVDMYIKTSHGNANRIIIHILAKRLFDADKMF